MKYYSWNLLRFIIFLLRKLFVSGIVFYLPNTCYLLYDKFILKENYSNSLIEIFFAFVRNVWKVTIREVMKTVRKDNVILNFKLMTI